MLGWFAGLFLALLICYSNHFANGFQFDDWHSVQYNPAIRSLSNVPKMFVDSTTFSVLRSAHSYRPVVTASLALDYALGAGLNPFWFHLSTFFWLLVLLAAMYVVCVDTFDRASPDSANHWTAWLAVAIYGLHPAGAETVNYIIQRGDLYVVLGIAAGIAMYARAPHLRRFGIYLIPPLAAMLAKPPALIFAPVLLAYILLIDRAEHVASRGDSAVRERGRRQGSKRPSESPAERPSRESVWSCLRRSLPAFGLCAAFVVVENAMTSAHFFATRGSTYEYLITQPFVALRYFRSFFVPLYLSPDTDLQPFQSPWNLAAIAGFAFLILLIAAAVRTARIPEWRAVSFGLWWYLLGLLPTSIYPLAEVENDHRMYLPFAGLTIAVVSAGAIVLRRLNTGRAGRMAAAGVSIGVLLAFAWGTHRRNEVWKTSETLWRDVIEKSPNNPRGLMGFGGTLLAKGDAASAYRYYERAAAINPGEPAVEVNLGAAAAALCRDAEADAHFGRALQLAPHDGFGYIAKAKLQVARNEPEKALQTFQKAFEQQAFFLLSSYGLMEALAHRQDWTGLRSVVDDVLRLSPGDSLAVAYLYLAENRTAPVGTAERRAELEPTAQAFLDLSLMYNHAGRYEDAIRAARRSLDIEPGSPWAAGQIAAAQWWLSRKACQQRSS